VDDNDFNLATLSLIVERSVLVAPDQARDGLEALKAFKRKFERESVCARADCPKKQHRVIFMDLNMPNKDGFDSSREILAFARQRDPSRVPSIMALTAFVGKDTVKRCLDLGMKEVLNKPADAALIVQMVRKHAPELRGFTEEAERRKLKRKEASKSLPQMR